MARTKKEITEGEWVILEVVWQLEPVPAPTVQEALQPKKQWAYSTVKTMMDRMVEKGLLRTEKIRNLFLYRSAISRPQAQKGELMQAVRRAFNGAFTPMMQFLIDSGNLSEGQLAELENLIRDKRKEAKEPKTR